MTDTIEKQNWKIAKLNQVLERYHYYKEQINKKPSQLSKISYQILGKVKSEAVKEGGLAGVIQDIRVREQTLKDISDANKLLP